VASAWVWIGWWCCLLINGPSAMCWSTHIYGPN